MSKIMIPAQGLIIVMPKTQKEGVLQALEPVQNQGIVMVPSGYGEDQAGNKLTAEIGDEILFSPHGSIPVSHNGEDYLVMRESDILVTFKETLKSN